mmetsp:Transcript_25879/g.51028  ORF Transcript_25879/g.51028 Transcript_25879/m.51028 type:complete len:277 (+) Transcript_25879:597-1427(+)
MAGNVIGSVRGTEELLPAGLFMAIPIATGASPAAPGWTGIPTDSPLARLGGRSGGTRLAPLLSALAPPAPLLGGGEEAEEEDADPLPCPGWPVLALSAEVGVGGSPAGGRPPVGPLELGKRGGGEADRELVCEWLRGLPEATGTGVATLAVPVSVSAGEAEKPAHLRDPKPRFACDEYRNWRILVVEQRRVEEEVGANRLLASTSSPASGGESSCELVVVVVVLLLLVVAWLENEEGGEEEEGLEEEGEPACISTCLSTLSSTCVTLTNDFSASKE